MWGGIVALAVLVLVLFIFDPFARSSETDPLHADDETPFVAFFPRDEVVDEVGPSDEPDEVLGSVTRADDDGTAVKVPMAADGDADQ